VVTPAAVVLVTATPVATWRLVGDQSTVPLSADPGDAIRPWHISPAIASAAGSASLAAAAAMTVLLAEQAASRNGISRRCSGRG
jgi:hypothetical protein